MDEHRLNASLRRLLLVEDSRLIAASMSADLSALGYRVETRHTGEDGVAAVQDDPAIDLVLMDVHLGRGIDGFTAAERILAVRDLPVVFVTSDLNAASVERGRSISHYGYLAKDSDARALAEAVALALRLHEAHAATRAAEQHNHAVFFHAPAPLLLVDSGDGTVRDANAAAAGLLGLHSASLPGTTVEDQICPMDAERFRLTMAQSGHRECTVRLRGDGAAGHRVVRISIMPVDINGREHCYLSLFDVTEAEAARSELGRREERHAQLVRNAPVGIYRVFSDGETIEANHAMARILGCGTPEEARRLYPRLVTDLAEDPEALRALNLRLHEDGGISGEQLWIVRKDGARLCLRLDARVAAEHPDGRVEIEGFATDVTAQRQAQDFAQMLADQVPAMIWAYDVEAERNVWVNQRLERYLRARITDVPGAAVRDQVMSVIHPEDHDTILNATEAVMSAGGASSVPVEFRMRGDGAESWDWYRGSLVVFDASSAGAARLVMGSASLVQDLKQELEETSRNLEHRKMIIHETNHRVKNNLMLVSTLLSLHESTVQVDLGSIRGQVDAIAQVHDHLSRSDVSSTVQLDRQVASLLSVATVTDPRLRIRQDVEPLELSSRTAVSLGLLINELVTNAIKHGLPAAADPYLEVTCSRLDDMWVELAVANNGTPLPERFGEEDDGSSMGVTLITTLLSQMKGEMRIEREPMTRITCRLRIPVSAAAADRPTAPGPAVESPRSAAAPGSEPDRPASPGPAPQH